jgi:RHS repeat-associated protein
VVDKNANVVATTDPFGNKSTQTFDGDNNPLVSVDRDGNKITNTWDPGNRLSSQLRVAPNGAQSDSLAWTYDKNDNTLTASNVNGTYTFTPDPANFITSQTDPFAKTLTFTPDPDYNVTQISDSVGGTLNSTYNANDMLDSRTFTNGTQQLGLKVTYNNNDEPNLIKRYSDTALTQFVGQTQIGYDALGVTTSIQHTNGSGSTLENFAYTLDIGERLSSETDTINGTATTTGYGYDLANQLTSAGSNTYAFDFNGNRNNSGFVVGANNQLSTDGSWNFTYDPEGNLVKKTGVAGGPNAGLTWVLTYNAANQLVGATETNGSTQVVQETNYYDVFGNWLEQDVSLNGGAPTITKFAQQVVNNDPGTVGQDPVWADMNSTNQVTTRRIWALDQVFARISQSGTVDYELTDRLGSYRGLMNPSGTLDDSETFDAIGNKTSESTAANGDRFGFAGGQADGYLGVTLFGRRWYNPKDQTWLSQDPLGLAAGTNPYEYVGNGPVNGTDLSGLQAQMPGPGGPAYVTPRAYAAPGGQMPGEPQSTRVMTFDAAQLEWIREQQQPGVFGFSRTRRFEDWVRDRGIIIVNQNGDPDPRYIPPNDSELPEAGGPGNSPSRVGVGQPGLLESFAPVWGSGRAAIDHFQNGEWGWGLVNSGLAITDVFLVRSLVGGAIKLGKRAFTSRAARQAAAVQAVQADRAIVASMFQGAFGGRIPTAAELLAFRRNLWQRLRVEFATHSPNNPAHLRLLEGERASFRGWSRSGRAVIIVSEHATSYEILHEWLHAVHFRRIGGEAYRNLSPRLREQFVYDRLRLHYWDRLNLAQRVDARAQVLARGGRAW